MSGNRKIYFGGVPTDGELKLLLEAFDDLKEEAVITHDQITEVIGVEWKTDRYRTVTDRWKKTIFREQNIDIAAIPSVGFRVLTPDERVKYGIKDAGSAHRKLTRARTRTGRADTKRLSEQMLLKQEHAMRLFDAQLEDSRRNQKTIAIAEKIRPLPRPDGG